MKKTIIFDVDGTLVDTNRLHVQSWIKTFKEFGVVASEEELSPMIGTGGEKITKKFFSPEQVEKFSETAISNHSSNISRIAKTAKVFPKVRELFSELKKRGKKIVLATSAQQIIVDTHIKNMQVADLIDATVSSSEVKRTKPDPDIFLKALEKAETKAADSVVVGDTVWDIMAAQKIGIPSVAVLTGGSSREGLLRAGAVEVYKDVAELLSKLNCSILS